MIEVTLRVYGALNDFLPAHRRQTPWERAVDGHLSVKDFIERAGIPHPEIDLVLVNGLSVGFDESIWSGDRIAVFPRFVTFDISAQTRVRPRPLEQTRFVADVHLGKLARRLRLAGLDTAYEPGADDAALAALAARQGRILLTRDVRLLMRRSVTHGYFIRETDPQRQLVECFAGSAPSTSGHSHAASAATTSSARCRSRQSPPRFR